MLGYVVCEEVAEEHGVVGLLLGVTVGQPARHERLLQDVIDRCYYIHCLVISQRIGVDLVLQQPLVILLYRLVLKYLLTLCSKRTHWRVDNRGGLHE